MQQAIEHRAGRGGVAEQFSPIVDGTVRSNQRARALVAPHHELEQILGRRRGEFAHAEIVEDQERHARERLESVLASFGERGFGELFEQCVVSR